MKSLIQGFLTGTRGQARALAPRQGTEAGDISPVFAALEHAPGDFTTLGKNPLLEYSSPPSDTFSNYSNLQQKRAAEDTIADVGASGLRPGKVVTEVTAAGPFWEARTSPPCSS
jgi:hypothetical protein